MKKGLLLFAAASVVLGVPLFATAFVSSVSVPEASDGYLNTAEDSDGFGIIIDLSSTSTFPGDIVSLYEGATLVTSSPALAGGETSYPFTLPSGSLAPDGAKALTAFLNVTALPGAPASFVLDTLAPTLSPVTIASDNANPSWAKTGDTATVTFVADETLQNATATIALGTTLLSGGGTNWSAQYVFAGGETEGLVPFAIDFSDLAGNPGVQISATTDASSVTFDKTAPIVTAAAYATSTGMFKIGDVITLLVTADAAGYTDTATLVNAVSTTGFTDLGGGNYSAIYTIGSGDADQSAGNVPASVVLSDAAGNANVPFIAVTPNTVAIDANPPVATVASIFSDNLSPTLAKIGDTVTVVVTSSEPLSGITGTIAGQVASVLGSIANWLLQYPMTIGEAEGSVPFSFIMTDVAGNAGAAVSATTDASSVTFDKTAPTLPMVTIVSNNASTTWAKVGDTVTVSLSASENLQTPSVTIAGNPAIVTGSGASWTATYVMAGTDTEGVIPFSVTFSDLAGNAGAAVSATTDASSVTFDKTAPVVSPLVFSPNTGVRIIGDAVTMTIDADEAGYGLVSAIMNGVATTGFTDNADTTYTVTYTVLAGHADQVAGAVPASVVLSDAAGNVNTAYTTVAANTLSIDANAPSFASVSIASNNADPVWAKVGDTVTVSFTTSEAIQTPSASIVGSIATISGSGTSWTATYVMAGGDTEGVIVFTIDPIADLANNTAPGTSATTDASSVTFDKTPPNISNMAYVPPTGARKIGDTLTLAVTADAPGYTAGTILVNGIAPTSFTDMGAGLYDVIYTIFAGHTDRTMGTVPATVTMKDAASNSTTSWTVAPNSVSVDATPPALPAVTIGSSNPNPTWAKVGDTVTVSLSASENLQTPSVTIAGNPATVTGSGASWTATYVMAGGDTEGVIPFSVTFNDLAGNAGAAVSATTDASSVTFDKTAPVVSGLAYTPNSGWRMIGDGVTLDISADAAGYSLSAATLNGVVVTGFTDLGGGSYQATYTVVVGDTDRAAGTIPASVALSDAAGNVNTVYTTVTANTLALDAHTPTLSAVIIASNNSNPALAKVGDTVTVSLSASENLQTPSVTIAGNPATVTGSGASWTATYVMAGGDTEGVIPFSVTFNDLAGNAGAAVSATTDASSVTFDKTAPTLPTVTIASNNASTTWAKVGDTVTVSFSASENLQTPSVTIAGNPAIVTGSGASWTATYVMAGTDTEGAIPFSVTFNDLAGNAGAAVSATTDASSVTFDKTAPTITVLGTNPVSIQESLTYTDAGATVDDGSQGNITNRLSVANPVNTNVQGTYTVTYTASDKAGNGASPATRTVTVTPGGGSIYTVGGGGGGPFTPQNTTSSPTPRVLGVTQVIMFARDLSLGATGADVRALCDRLVREGLYGESCGDVFDDALFAAVKRYQSKYGIPATGYVGPLTRARLNTGTVLGVSDANAGVIQERIAVLQEQLVVLLKQLVALLASQQR